MEQAIYQVGILLVFNFYGKSILNLENDETEHANMVKNTLIFNGFVLCQVSLSNIQREKTLKEKIIWIYCCVFVFDLVVLDFVPNVSEILSDALQ